MSILQHFLLVPYYYHQTSNFFLFGIIGESGGAAGIMIAEAHRVYPTRATVESNLFSVFFVGYHKLFCMDSMEFQVIVRMPKILIFSYLALEGISIILYCIYWPLDERLPGAFE